jgi:hypothetical protein
MNTIDLQGLRAETARLFLNIQEQVVAREELLTVLAKSDGVTPYIERELRQDIGLLRAFTVFLSGHVTHFATVAPTSLHQV